MIEFADGIDEVVACATDRLIGPIEQELARFGISRSHRRKNGASSPKPATPPVCGTRPAGCP
jgi:hypothetical protein